VKHIARISSIDVLERVGGGMGLHAAMDGLRIMKEWCAENATGKWRYAHQSRGFRFEVQQDAMAFREAFREAFAIHPVPTSLQ
jgi:hypothetical protein